MLIQVEIILDSKYLVCKEYLEYKFKHGFQNKQINIGVKKYKRKCRQRESICNKKDNNKN